MADKRKSIYGETPETFGLHMETIRLKDAEGTVHDLRFPSRALPYQEVTELVKGMEPDSNDTQREQLTEQLLRVWSDWSTLEVLRQAIVK
jgi:hypothetical protein